MKDDIPPLRMTVEAGKLTPADAFSAERLESYRHGTTMFVQPITDPQTKKRRKFWAILGLVIRNCNTPWRTVKDAANAIKRTFGLMDDGGTTGNVRIMYPRSLNDLSEPEFEEFYEDAMLLLQRITGVDPETLAKESPGSDAPLLQPDEGSGDRKPSTASDAAAAPDLKAEAIDKFLRLATDKHLTPPEKRSALATVEGDWLHELPDKAAFVKACSETTARVIEGELKAQAAKRYLSALASKPEENGDEAGES
ncbi:hypothetical protein GHK50_19250 [Sinorhizobium medicae]|uniref:Uncharacterized protein n=1 Tax=Sinorhizobium medicae TaxID=110321 RepID=A0A6G1WJ71_9HYPH|nr:hypothetical protein [Sinorhizobium medicae]MQW69779.1 hypothetical protein [Sinorhizobium medicae]MQX46528.1 hypothetical protein [Sinorhizobium medicae]MQX85219.1 hypothetical protein [Sinorhizobium medicae]